MSLNSSLSTAISGLQTNQTLMRVASANIANVNTEGYTKKTGELSALVLGGVGAGVQIADIVRAVDNFLVKEANNQTSVVAKSDILHTYYSRLDDLFGTPADNSSISGLMNDLRTALDQLATDPSQSVRQYSTVTAAKDVVDKLNTLAQTLQTMRMDVDRQIDDSIAKVNTALQRIDKLNSDIVRNKVIGSPTGDLEDERDQQLQVIAKEMDIKWFGRADGSISVMTGSNYILLDSAPRELSYSPSSGVSKATVYPAGFDSIPIEGQVDDITALIKNGNMAGYIALRDSILPGLQDQIDQLTTLAANEINRAHNSAMPIPGLKTFTGLTTFDNSVLLDATNPQSIPLTAYDDGTGPRYGSLQFAITDSNGNGVGDALRVNLDEFKTQMESYVSGITGSPYTYNVTVGDIVNMINGAYAATPPVGIPVPTAPAGWPGAAPWPPSPALVMPSSGSDIAGLFNLSGASVSGGLSNGAFADVQNGALVITLPSTSQYGLAIDDKNSTFAVAGETRPSTFNYLMGLNNLFVIPDTAISSSQSVSVRQDILDDPSKIGRGTLTSLLRDPTDPTTEEWYVAKGDGTGATAMADVFDSQFSFVKAGDLPPTTARLTEYAAAIVQLNASNASTASDNFDFQTSLLTDLKNKIGEVSGVSVDEELAHLVSIQSAYAASARVVTTVNSMYDDLLSLMR